MTVNFSKWIIRGRIFEENSPEHIARRKASRAMDDFFDEFNETNLEFETKPDLYTSVIQNAVKYFTYFGDMEGFSREFTFEILREPKNIRELGLVESQADFRNCVAERVESILSIAKKHGVSEDICYGSFRTMTENRQRELELEAQLEAQNQGMSYSR